MRHPAKGTMWLATLVGMTLLVSGCTSGKLPEVSDDGLLRTVRTSNGAIYEAPDLDLHEYGKIVVEECTVRFREDWQREQNRDRTPARQITTADMQMIAESLGGSCHRIFDAALAQVDLGTGDVPGQGRILEVRPEIVDLDIAPPDLQSPGMDRTYTTNPGQMTLHLELVDAASGAVVGRVVDRRRARDTATLLEMSAARNQIEMEFILEQWATMVREHLEASVD